MACSSRPNLRRQVWSRGFRPAQPRRRRPTLARPPAQIRLKFPLTLPATPHPATPGISLPFDPGEAEPVAATNARGIGWQRQIAI